MVNLVTEKESQSVYLRNFLNQRGFIKGGLGCYFIRGFVLHIDVRILNELGLRHLKIKN